jgi:hypothetical protein
MGGEEAAAGATGAGGAPCPAAWAYSSQRPSNREWPNQTEAAVPARRRARREKVKVFTGRTSRRS